MPETLLDTTNDSEAEDATDRQSSEPVATAPPPLPDGIPAKFWDEETGTLRGDALVKSYKELERKLGKAGETSRPASPEDYAIAEPNELVSSDQDINAALFEAGFTQEQAQLVYDLAADRLMPMVAEVASVFEAERQIERLVEHFGGQDQWRGVARQLSTWGRKQFPAPVFEALASTADGVLAMHRMVCDAEPSLVRDDGGIGHPFDESALKNMMRDPRYWRDRDPAVVAQVKEGFKRLFPE